MLKKQKISPDKNAARRAALLYPQVFRELCINLLDIEECKHGGGFKELSVLNYETERLEQTLDYLRDEIAMNGGQLPEDDDCLWACSKEERPKILRFMKMKGGASWL